jgi:hypothetical protein
VIELPHEFLNALFVLLIVFANANPVKAAVRREKGFPAAIRARLLLALDPREAAHIGLKDLGNGD